MSQYKGKSVLVTGAQQGIGRSMVLNFAKEGANVAINWHNDKQKALSVCLLYTSPSPRDGLLSRMPSSA